MARKQKLVNKATKRVKGSRRRLTDAEKAAIASFTGTIKEACNQFGVSAPTVLHWRKAGKGVDGSAKAGGRGRRTLTVSAKGGRSIPLVGTFEGSELVVRISRPELLRMLAEIG